MKRSSPLNPIRTDLRKTRRTDRRGGSWYRRAVCVAALLALSCTAARDGERGFDVAGAADGCRALDSMLARSGWRDDVEMSGRVTIDVKQYRVRGRFDLMAEPDGDLVFEFSGNMVLGGHHEDVVVSWYGEELRVLDRERGRLYEGGEVGDLVVESLGEKWNVVELIKMVTARLPDCGRLSSVKLSGDGGRSRVEGRLDGERFRLDYFAGRLARASWPVSIDGGSPDRLELTYEWETDADGASPRLAALVLYLEGRRWRIKLQA